MLPAKAWSYPKFVQKILLKSANIVGAFGRERFSYWCYCWAIKPRKNKAAKEIWLTCWPQRFQSDLHIADKSNSSLSKNFHNRGLGSKSSKVASKLLLRLEQEAVPKARFNFGYLISFYKLFEQLIIRAWDRDQKRDRS